VKTVKGGMLVNDFEEYELSETTLRAFFLREIKAFHPDMDIPKDLEVPKRP
jgi:hypothetical protein